MAGKYSSAVLGGDSKEKEKEKTRKWSSRILSPGAPQDEDQAMETKKPDYSGALLPLSRKDGELSFDSDAGIVGMFKRAIMAPGQVMRGELDPMSDEGSRRALESALIMSPMPVASRAASMAYKAPAVPTARALKSAKEAGYKKAGDAGVEFSASSVKEFAKDLRKTLEEGAYLEKQHSEVFDFIKILENPPPDATVRLKMLDSIRKQFGKLGGNKLDATKAGVANIAKSKLDEFLEIVGPADTLARTTSSRGTLPSTAEQLAKADSKDASDALSTLRDARGNAAAEFRSERITGMEELAELKAKASNSGRNYDNTTRQRLLSLYKDAKKTRGMSKEELSAIKDIIEGRPTKNAARFIGNMFGGGGGLGSNVLSIMGGVGGAAVTGGPGGAAAGYAIPWAIGSAGRATANSMTKAEVKALDKLIRSRSPLAESLVPTFNPSLMPTSPLARALLYNQNNQ